MAEDSAIGPLPAHWQRDFLQRHQLPASYLEAATRWFDPLARCLQAAAAGTAGPILVGINGCQGSGKSTLCDYLATRLTTFHGCNTVVLSLDDFYLTRDERLRLATTVHPLLATRGVPGTHDMPLLRHTLDALQVASTAESVDIPRFNKARDDRHPPAAWDRVTRPVDIILLEGWCLGARPETSLQPPLNTLEATEDTDARWRHYANDALAAHFLPLYDRIGLWIMLRAPDFDCVYEWRLEQEHKLARTANGPAVMSDSEVARFTQHYERVTRWCLEHLSAQVDILYHLDATRRVQSVGASPHGPCPTLAVRGGPDRPDGPNGTVPPNTDGT